MILITDEVDGAIKQGKYLACAYCGSKRLIKVGETSEFKKLFKNDEKKRQGGNMSKKNRSPGNKNKELIKKVLSTEEITDKEQMFCIYYQWLCFIV